MRRICFLVNVALVIGFSVLPASGEEHIMEETALEWTMRVYFTPFDVHTYSPVTMENIDDKSVYALLFTKNHPVIDRIRNLLKGRPATGRLEASFIRLKVDFGKEIFYVDSGGRVLEKNTNRRFELLRDEMQELERTIIYFDGVIDIRASKRVM